MNTDQMNQAVSSPQAPAAIGPYSQAIRNGREIYVSGQLPIDPKTGSIASDDIRDQTRQCLCNIRSILQAAGADMGNVVKTTVILRHISDFAAMNEVYASFFSDPFPARGTFQAGAMFGDALVEIEAVAIL